VERWQLFEVRGIMIMAYCTYCGAETNMGLRDNGVQVPLYIVRE
jgi:hypothetical protein